MYLHKKLLYASVVLTSTGVVFAAPYGYIWATGQVARANAVPTQVITTTLPQTPTLITGKPVRLTIPSLAISLEVADGSYNQDKGDWTLSPDKAHFALPTTQPNNESGNTLIYGHNRAGVFSTLNKLQPGAEVLVDTDNGYRFIYTFATTEAVSPTNTDIFAYQGEPRLTLQTCSGAWFQNRQFFYFDFVRYEAL